MSRRDDEQQQGRRLAFPAGTGSRGGTPPPCAAERGRVLATVASRVPLALGLAALLLGPASLGGQEPAPCDLAVPGRVLSAADGSPVAGASVVLPSLQLRLLTDGAGRFLARGVCAGPLELSVSHLGFGTTTLQATVAPDELLVIRMRPRAVPLEGLVVEVEPVLRRLESRRMAIGQKSGVYEADDFDLRDLPTSIPQYVASRTGHPLQPCTGSVLDRDACYPYRGGMAEVEVVCVDSAPIEGGLDVLELWPQDDIVRLEFYPGLGMMKVFTRSFMLQAAEHPWLLEGRLDHC